MIADPSVHRKRKHGKILMKFRPIRHIVLFFKPNAGVLPSESFKLYRSKEKREHFLGEIMIERGGLDVSDRAIWLNLTRKNRMSR
jgi:hypothetical protein